MLLLDDVVDRLTLPPSTAVVVPQRAVGIVQDDAEISILVSRISKSWRRWGRDLMEAFIQLDGDGNGRLTHDEFEAALMSVPLGLSRMEVSRLYEALPGARYDAVTYPEFRAMIKMKEKIRIGERLTSAAMENLGAVLKTMEECGGSKMKCSFHIMPVENRYYGNKI